MPGPAPKPTLVKIRDGNPGARPLNTREPKPSPTTPPCPEPVRRNKHARECWNQHVAILTAERNKVLTVADGALLAQFCLVSAEILCLQDRYWAVSEEALVVDGGDVGNGEDGGIVAIDTSTVEGRSLARLRNEQAALQAQQERLAFTQLYTARKLQAQYMRELGLGPVARTRVQTTGSTGQMDNDPWAELDNPGSKPA